MTMLCVTSSGLLGAGWAGSGRSYSSFLSKRTRCRRARKRSFAVFAFFLVLPRPRQSVLLLGFMEECVNTSMDSGLLSFFVSETKPVELVRRLRTERVSVMGCPKTSGDFDPLPIWSCGEPVPEYLVQHVGRTGKARVDRLVFSWLLGSPWGGRLSNECADDPWSAGAPFVVTPSELDMQMVGHSVAQLSSPGWLKAVCRSGVRAGLSLSVLCHVFSG